MRWRPGLKKFAVTVGPLLFAGLFWFFVAGAANAVAGAPVAQKPDCQAGYDSVRANCQTAAFACYDGCDRYSAGFYECQRACMTQDRDCIAAANEKYKDCPITPSESGAINVVPTDQSDEASVKKALVAERPTAEDFASEDEQDKKDGLREGSDEQWYFGLPYGPYVSNAQSDYTFNYRITFTRKDNDGDPEVLLPDGSKLDYTYRSLSDFRGIPPGTKIKTPPGVEVRLKFFMDQTRKTTAFGYDPYADNVFTRNMSVDIGENSELTVEEVYNGFVKIVVNDGYARFRKRKPVPLSPASPAGVMLGTKGTDFGVAYDPATKQTIAEIYDGTIEVIDFENGNVLHTLAAKYGEPILSAQITADKTVIQKIAIPGSEWSAYSEQKSRPESESESFDRSRTWIIVIIALLLGGAGFWLYEKGWLKRFLPQKNQS